MNSMTEIKSSLSVEIRQKQNQICFKLCKNIIIMVKICMPNIANEMYDIVCTNTEWSKR
jgi:hypothetical protein